MLIKILVVILFLLILLSLGSGLFYLVKDQGKTKRTAKALTYRIAISLIAFLLLITVRTASFAFSRAPQARPANN